MSAECGHEGAGDNCTWRSLDHANMRKRWLCIGIALACSVSAGLASADKFALLLAPPRSSAPTEEEIDSWLNALEEGKTHRTYNDMRYPLAKPAVGEPVPDFVLRDLEGNEVRLKDQIGRVPIVLEIGAFT